MLLGAVVVGIIVVGLSEGTVGGLRVGLQVGSAVGIILGVDVVGLIEGTIVGFNVGVRVGI